LDLDSFTKSWWDSSTAYQKDRISNKTAFNIMPFENKVVVAQMKGSVLMKLVNYLTKAKRAHPISGMDTYDYPQRNHQKTS